MSKFSDDVLAIQASLDSLKTDNTAALAALVAAVADTYSTTGIDAAVILLTAADSAVQQLCIDVDMALAEPLPT